MQYGYVNSAVEVNLSTGAIKEFKVPEDVLELYLGGRGMGAYFLYTKTPAGMDPYDPGMYLIFGTGPLTATNAPQSNRFTVTTKSPLTGAIADSHCGGNFATKLKKAGVDFLLITGEAKKPVYIDITDGKVQIKDAAHLWGKGTYETQEILPKKHGKAVIGPAGENLVRFAGIFSQERAAGRCGTGAVMGAKKLKAVIANGSKKIEIAHPEKFNKLRKEITQFKLNHPMMGGPLKKLGTANLVNITNSKNIIPVKNFQSGADKRSMQISGEEMEEKYLKKSGGCLTCPIQCGRVVELDGKNIKGPEYETIGLNGANLEIFDLPSIFKINYLADDLGMDSISLGSTIGFAMELNQKGMWNNGLKWGDCEAVVETVKKIAHRDGIGDELAEGVKRVSEKYGGKQFAMHVKGLELPAYDPRGCWGQGLEYATTNRGGCHIRGSTMYLEATGHFTVNPHTVKAKPELVIMQQNMNAAVSSMIMCWFSSYAMIPSQAFSLSPTDAIYKALAWLTVQSGPAIRLTFTHKANLPVLWFEKFLNTVLGTKMGMGGFNKIGDRTFNLERIYNMREGFTRDDDTLPPRVLNENSFDGVDARVPLDKMLPAYYKIRGWDKDGVPTAKNRRKLNIEF